MSGHLGSEAGRKDSILAWLWQREDEMAALLSELVAIPTENPPGRNYQACAALLERRLRNFGLDCERFFEPAGPEKKSGESPACLLACFGRGSCDMKGGIVAMLYAILALKECGAELNGRAGLMLVPNEETGGAGGSAWLAQQGLLGRNGIGMLLAEPTGGVVWNANRGAISLRVQVFGKSAHVGLQHQGENAFERMHRVVERLQELKREVEQRTTLFNIGAGQARNSILMLGGQSGGGANFNVVPEKCWFTVDRRINPEEDLDAEKARLLGVLEQCKHEGIPLEWEILQEGSSAACREDNPLGKVLAGNVKAVTGQAPRFEMCPGLLETRFYAAEELPAYAYGPGLLSVAHGPNEHVDLRKMIDCAAIYALTAIGILGR